MYRLDTGPCRGHGSSHDWKTLELYSDVRGLGLSRSLHAYNALATLFLVNSGLCVLSSKQWHVFSWARVTQQNVRKVLKWMSRFCLHNGKCALFFKQLVDFAHFPQNSDMCLVTQRNVRIAIKTVTSDNEHNGMCALCSKQWHVFCNTTECAPFSQNSDKCLVTQRTVRTALKTVTSV